jgi:hypothetical protein
VGLQLEPNTMTSLGKLTNDLKALGNSFRQIHISEEMCLRLYLPAVIALGIVSFCIFYPGMMTADSWEQWKQASENVYSSWHPPIMAWWWGWLKRHVWDNYTVLLLFHLLLFWGGVYVLGSVLGRRAFLLACLCIGLWFIPPVMGMTSFLWKDSGMACSWFLASALMAANSSQQKRFGVFAAGAVLLLLMYGNAVRHNALTGLLPLCYWFTLCVCDRPCSFRRKLLLSLVVFGGLCAAKITIDTSLASTNIYEGFEQIATDNPDNKDIAAQLLLLHDPIKIYSRMDLPFDRQYYTSASPYEMYIMMLVEHPMEYLSYRWEKFSRLIGIDTSHYCQSYYWPNKSDISEDASIRSWAHGYLHAAFQSFWYEGNLWLGLNIVMLIIGLRCLWKFRPVMHQVVLLNASALMYFLPFFFIATSCDFRYLYWPVLAVSCSILIACQVFYGRSTQRVKNEPGNC